MSPQFFEHRIPTFGLEGVGGGRHGAAAVNEFIF